MLSRYTRSCFSYSVRDSRVLQESRTKSRGLSGCIRACSSPVVYRRGLLAAVEYSGLRKVFGGFLHCWVSLFSAFVGEVNVLDSNVAAVTSARSGGRQPFATRHGCAPRRCIVAQAANCLLHRQSTASGEGGGQRIQKLYFTRIVV